MRAALLILAMLLPAVAAADDAAPTPTADAAASTSSAQATRPAVGPTERKRRGSTVGYIIDATIEDQLRVRFDAGFGNDVPDRAEFFYAQCGCNGGGAPGPGAPGAGDLVTKLRFQQLAIEGQYAFKRRNGDSRISVFAAIPVRFVQPQSFLGASFKPPVSNTFQSASGLSDVRVGVKAAIFSDIDTTLSAQVQGFFKTGDAKKGLGTDHGSIEFAMLLNRRFADQFGLEAQIGDWHPTGGSASNGVSYSGDVFFWGIGPSYEIINTGRVTFAPVVEFVSWRVLGGLQQNQGALTPADGTNIFNVKVGARTTIDNRSSIYVGYGHALTNAVWYSDIIRVEYRYSF